MTVKEFVEKYNNIVTDNLRKQHLKDNLHIKNYIPFLTKITIADKIAKITTLNKDTGNISVNSHTNYLLFCRSIIEQYTDLQIETEGFCEEYDLLNESGLLDEIMQRIPEKEIKEFKTLCDMGREDYIFNNGTTKAFISSQVTRFGELLGITLQPVFEKISERLENLDEKDVEKITKALERGLKRVK